MATSDQTAAPNRSVDEILDQTEIGAMISKHKSSAIGLVVLAFIGVAGFGIWNWMSQKKTLSAETAIHQFNTSSLKELSENKLAASDFVTKFEGLQSEIGNYSGLFPIAIESANILMNNQNFEQTISVLEKSKGLAGNNYQKFILNFFLATAYENAGQVDKAVVSLEDIVKLNSGIMESKVYLDLGRLALKLGQNEKARTNLQWVVDKGTDAEMTLLARLYLSQLDQ